MHSITTVVVEPRLEKTERSPASHCRASTGTCSEELPIFDERRIGTKEPKMPCWAHQKQLSYQLKQEKEFTQNLGWTPDDSDDWDTYDPAPSSGDLSVGVKSE